jgi:hypothetical protein
MAFLFYNQYYEIYQGFVDLNKVEEGILKWTIQH